MTIKIKLLKTAKRLTVPVLLSLADMIGWLNKHIERMEYHGEKSISKHFYEKTRSQNGIQESENRKASL